MKKYLLLLLLLMLLFTTGCNRVNNSEILTRNEAEKIKASLKSEYKLINKEDRVDIFMFLGEFDGAYILSLNVLKMNGPQGYILSESTYIEKEDIAGYIFNYNGRNLSVYKEGKLYSLSEAYENGTLTETDISKIYQKFNEIRGLIGGYYQDLFTYGFNKIISSEKIYGVILKKNTKSNTIVIADEIYSYKHYLKLLREEGEFETLIQLKKYLFLQ